MNLGCGSLPFTDFFFIFLVSYVGERPWWPIQSPNKIKKEEIESLRGERDQIKFIDPRFERYEGLVWREVGSFGMNWFY